MNKKSPKFQGPSTEEKALRASQKGLLDMSANTLQSTLGQLDLLAPLLFKETGIEPIMQNGEIVGFNRTQDGNSALRGEVEKGLLERSKAALEGKLPLDPVLLKELGRQEEELNNTLRSRLGSGYDVSSAGIQALGDFGLNKAIAMSDSARKDLVTAEGLAINRNANTNANIDAVISRALGITSAPAGVAQAMGSVASGYGDMSQVYQQDRVAKYNADVKRAESSFGIGDVLGPAAQLAGMAMFAPTGGTMFSSMFGGAAAGAGGGGLMSSLKDMRVF
jgi:hypothetical protein